MGTSRMYSSPVIIVLDSTEVFEDYELGKPWIRGLALYAKAESVQVIVPEVVIQELMRQARDDLWIPANRALNRLRRTTGINSELPPQTGFLADLESRFRARLVEVGFEVGVIPNVPHAEVLSRMNARLHPFRSGSPDLEKGYKDYLIWRTALAAGHAGEEVVLVSRNNDFVHGGAGLHRDLADEAASLGVTASAYKGSEFMLETLVRPWMKKAAGLLRRLERHEEQLQVAEQLSKSVSDVLGGVEWNPGEINLDPELDTVYVSNFDPMLPLENIDASEISDHEVLLSFTVSGDVLLDAYPPKEVAYYLNDPRVYVSDWDWNNHCVAAEISAEATFEIRLIVDPDSLEVQKTEVVSIQVE